ncbi:MAG: DUF2244 domain-containing protein [Proteobacteria bacterium]|nr:DUF2244 domain-containing protein [Pseudomonadota bacterium]
MVTELENGATSGSAWLLRPTRSMTWREAKRFILLVTLMCATIGAGFAWFGLWMVMPFCGIEALAVALAFYLVLRDGERRELVRIEGEKLVIETGNRELEQRHEFNSLWVRVDLARSRYRHHPTRLFVGTHGRAVELGRFLTDGERDSLSRSLINALKKNR